MRFQRTLVWLVVSSAGCAPSTNRFDAGNNAGSDAAAGMRAQWMCPEEWVPSELGGCGPAVLLCASGGAVAGSCDGVSFSRAHARSDGSPGFYLAENNDLRGGWRAVGAMGGPPREVTLRDGWQMCPEGWSRGSDGRCDPALPSTCAEGSMPIPSANAAQRCTSTASDRCESGMYPSMPADAPSGARAVYVNPGGSDTTGDGSRERPYASVTVAVRSAGTGTPVLLLADGVYAPAVVGANAWVVGRCSTSVVLLGSTGRGLHVMDRAQATVRNVRVRNGSAGIEVASGAALTLRNVWIERSVTAGIFVSGAGTTLRGSDVVVQDTQLNAQGRQGFGLVVNAGAVVTLSRTHFVQSSEAHAVAAAGSRIELEDVYFGETRGRSDGSQGSGVLAFGGTVALRRAFLQRVHGGAVVSVGAGSMLEASDVLVREVLPERGNGFAAGFYSYMNGAMTVTRAAMVESGGRGMVVTSAGQINFDGVLVHSPRIVMGATERRSGVCAMAQIEGVLRGRGLRCEGAELAGIAAIGTTAVMDVRESSVRTSQTGLTAQEGGQLVGNALMLENNVYVGAVAAGSGSHLELRDSVVLGTRPDASGMYGTGVAATSGSELVLDRVRIDNNYNVGIGAHAAMVRGTDLYVGHTSRTMGGLGSGVQVQAGGNVTLERVIIEENDDTPFGSDGMGSQLHLTDALVRSGTTRERARGLGAFVQLGASLRVRRAVFEHLREAAVWASALRMQGTRVDLEDVLVRDVQTGPRGFGGALLVYGPVMAAVRRMAVQDVSGAALAAGRFRVNNEEVPGAVVQASDVYLRNVVRSTVFLTYENPMDPRPSGPPVAYGIYAGQGSSFSLERGVLERAGYGFYVLQGQLTLRSVVLHGNSEAAGAATGVMDASLVLDGVQSNENANNMILRDVELPETSSLPPPTSVCPVDGC